MAVLPSIITPSTAERESVKAFKGRVQAADEMSYCANVQLFAVSRGSTGLRWLAAIDTHSFEELVSE